ncbi:MAG: efflux RND transporter permease subunit [Zoogloea oleivorans]|jgi:CzcA family heavy metal efflux pump|uniref:efflux RND transporter permease subunit n=1 Tax=Zoogloea oleivorans TaxID=1552750 RepID=UPI002A365795|nr:efflux RND transporter permease subunit [Zoogloea oleivorans]MDY0034814.1 efflux RND transporter permease subunit [Zoogloea oleivorans]
MIGHIIAWSLRNKLFVVLAGVLLLAWGGWQAARTPVDVFPDLTAPAVTVVTEAHGMAPTDVENLVTFPIETVLNGAPGVRRVRSATKIGLSVVTVEFEWGTDLYRARQVVAERLQLARATLPTDIPAPAMTPAASIMGEILFIALVSDKHNGLTLKNVAEQVLKRRILAVPGVAEVLPIGGDTQQFQVTVKPERLAAYKLTLDEVVLALRESNQNASAGFYVEAGQEYLIQGQGRIVVLDDIAETVITVRDGQPVLIRHVAEVGIGAAPKRGVGSHNGKPAVVLGIQKQPGANTLELTDRLDRTLADIQAGLPAGMKIERHIFRQADFIETSIDNLLVALRDGAILVVAIVFAFLLSARATLITLVAIPLSLVAAILSMKALGATINTMTLGGMAIALGALVDDAIIVVENIVRRLRENLAQPESEQHTVLQVVFDATREIQGSIVFATLIIMLVFMPLFFLSGVEGRLMVPLGFAYVVSLAASLLVAITVTPVLAALVLPRSKIVRQNVEPRFLHAIKGGYRRVLDATLTRWKGVTLVSVLALVASLVALSFAGRAFLPDFNEGTLTVSTATLPGTALEESDRLGQQVEQILLSHPEVVATARRTGRAEGDPHAMDVSASEMEVTLKMRERSKEAFLAALRADLASIPGTQIVIGQPISHRIDHMLSGNRSNIAVKIFGPELPELRRLTGEIKALVQTVDGAVDVSDEQQGDIPFLTLRFRRDALARHGLSIRQVAETVEMAFSGMAVSRVQQGQASYDLAVRFDPSAKANIDAIRSTLVTTASGARIPLSALADIRNDRAPYYITRENVQRKMVVMANVAGRDLASVVDDIRRKIAAQVKLPAGYHVEYGGQFESAEEAGRTLLFLGVGVIAGIFLLLFVAFRTARDALLVMLNLPLAIIGGVIGVFAAGGVLSVASIIGFITLFGIATRNGVMMIAHIHHLVEHEGVGDAAEAVKRGAEERLVPILMTALAAGLALVPLALAAGQPGSEIQSPMAIVILFGLGSSTLLNMIVVPALYLRFGAIRKRLDQGPASHPQSEDVV